VNPYLGVAILCLVGGALFILPLIPALRELRYKSDAVPLTVVQQHAGEIRFFADGFRAYIKALEPVLQKCAGTGETIRGIMPDGTEYVLFGPGQQAGLPPLNADKDGCHSMIVAGTDLILPSATTFSKDIYSAGTMTGGTENRYRAILAEKNVHLGSGSTVMRWVHAMGNFSADPDCKLYGRISSDKAIHLSPGCSFLRLNAPQIVSEPAEEIDATPSGAVRGSVSKRTLLDGDCEIAAGEVFDGSLVVRGTLRIGAGARICGSVKSEENLILEAGVCVEGSLISAKKMRIGKNCRIHGPVIAERDMHIERGSLCGTLESATTVSAPRIEVEPGVAVLGTLWAREQGRVVSGL
jgi:cytoskeletal protein CcmA (bactofilin family)